MNQSDLRIIADVVIASLAAGALRVILFKALLGPLASWLGRVCGERGLAAWRSLWSAFSVNRDASRF